MDERPVFADLSMEEHRAFTYSSVDDSSMDERCAFIDSSIDEHRALVDSTERIAGHPGFPESKKSMPAGRQEVFAWASRIP
jgi:hypothetical protein